MTDWTPVEDIPHFGGALKGIYERGSRPHRPYTMTHPELFGPMAACKWDQSTANAPGPHDGVAAVDGRTGTLIAAWGADGVAFGAWPSEHRFEWEGLMQWKHIKTAMRMVVDIDEDLLDGAYFHVSAARHRPRDAGAPRAQCPRPAAVRRAGDSRAAGRHPGAVAGVLWGAAVEAAGVNENTRIMMAMGQIARIMEPVFEVQFRHPTRMNWRVRELCPSMESATRTIAYETKRNDELKWRIVRVLREVMGDSTSE